MSDNIERLARALANGDGEEREFHEAEHVRNAYMAEAEELLERSGIAAEIAALRARVAVLEAVIDAAGSKVDVFLDDLAAQIARDRAALRETGESE